MKQLANLVASVQQNLRLPVSGWQSIATRISKESEILEVLAYQFRRLDQAQPLASFDFDDVLHPLEYRIVDDLGIPPHKFLHTFHMPTNPLLSEAERQAIIAAFANPKYFYDIEFMPGIENLLKPQEYGARVKVESNAYSKQIGDLKRDQLLAAVPGLKPEQVVVHIIDFSRTYQKQLDPETTILHDDSPYNAEQSSALLISMPAWMPWTYSPAAIKQLSGRIVSWHDDLQNMIDFTCRVVHRMIG